MLFHNEPDNEMWTPRRRCQDHFPSEVFSAPSVVGSTTEGSGSSFYVLWSVSGWLANFSTWSGRRDLTYCCGCERGSGVKFSGCEFTHSYLVILSELCHVLGHFMGVCIFKMRQSDFRASRFETARDIYFLSGAYSFIYLHIKRFLLGWRFLVFE